MWFIQFYSLLLSEVMKPCSNVQYTHTQFTDNNTLQPEIVQFQQAPVRMLQPCRRVENSHSIALSRMYVQRVPSKLCQRNNFFCRTKITSCLELLPKIMEANFLVQKKCKKVRKIGRFHHMRVTYLWLLLCKLHNIKPQLWEMPLFTLLFISLKNCFNSCYLM